MSDKERDSIQEMEDIQKGLEAFLQQEMQEMQASGAGARRSTGRPAANAGTHSAEREAARPAPQMYDMREDDEEEEELDVIGSDRRAGSREDYAEDWDDPTYRRRQAARRETARKTSESRNGGARSSNADHRRQETSGRTRRSRRDDYVEDYEDDYNDRKRSGRRSGKREEIDPKADKKSRKGNKKVAKGGRKKKKSGLKRFLIAVALILVFLLSLIHI